MLDAVFAAKSVNFGLLKGIDTQKGFDTKKGVSVNEFFFCEIHGRRICCVAPTGAKSNWSMSPH